MVSPEEVIQQLYDNRNKLTSNNLAGYIDNEYPLSVIIAKNQEDVGIDDFRFQFYDVTEGISFQQKGPVPNNKMDRYFEMFPEAGQAIATAITNDVRRQQELEYQNDVYESQMGGDQEIDGTEVPTPEDEIKDNLTFLPDLSELEEMRRQYAEQFELEDEPGYEEDNKPQDEEKEEIESKISEEIKEEKAEETKSNETKSEESIEDGMEFEENEEENKDNRPKGKWGRCHREDR